MKVYKKGTKLVVFRKSGNYPKRLNIGDILYIKYANKGLFYDDNKKGKKGKDTVYEVNNKADLTGHTFKIHHSFVMPFGKYRNRNINKICNNG